MIHSAANFFEEKIAVLLGKHANNFFALKRNSLENVRLIFNNKYYVIYKIFNFLFVLIRFI